MKTLAFFTLFELAAACAWGAPIMLEVNPAYLGHDPAQGVFTFGANGLAGVPLSGQLFTADLLFPDDLVGRANGAPGNLSARLLLDISALGDPGLLSADSRGGFTSASGTITPLESVVRGIVGQPPALMAALDVPSDDLFRGMHFDLWLPANGGEVRGARLEFIACCDSPTGSAWYGFQFGTPTQVPEPAMLTLLACSLGVIGVAVWRRRTS